MRGHVVVLTTVGRPEDAERVARALLERRLVACVNVVPGLVSFYWWKRELEKGEERLLVMKTRADRFEDLRAAILELHPYDVPEVLALPVTAGHRPYLDWVDESVAPSGRAGARGARPRLRPARGGDRPRGRRRPRSPR